MKSRLLVCILSFVIVLSLGCIALAGSYIGNQRSGIFHYTSCKWAQKISSYNAVDLESRQEAIDVYHMRPCKVCRP